MQWILENNQIRRYLVELVRLQMDPTSPWLLYKVNYCMRSWTFPSSSLKHQWQPSVDVSRPITEGTEWAVRVGTWLGTLELGQYWLGVNIILVSCTQLCFSCYFFNPLFAFRASDYHHDHHTDSKGHSEKGEKAYSRLTAFNSCLSLCMLDVR